MFSKMIEYKVVATESSAFVSRSEQGCILCEQKDEVQREVQARQMILRFAVTKSLFKKKAATLKFNCLFCATREAGISAFAVERVCCCDYESAVLEFGDRRVQGRGLI